MPCRRSSSSRMAGRSEWRSRIATGRDPRDVAAPAARGTSPGRRPVWSAPSGPAGRPADTIPPVKRRSIERAGATRSRRSQSPSHPAHGMLLVALVALRSGDVQQSTRRDQPAIDRLRPPRQPLRRRRRRPTPAASHRPRHRRQPRSRSRRPLSPPPRRAPEPTAGSDRPHRAAAATRTATSSPRWRPPSTGPSTARCSPTAGSSTTANIGWPAAAGCGSAMTAPATPGSSAQGAFCASNDRLRPGRPGRRRDRLWRPDRRARSRATMATGRSPSTVARERAGS